MAVKVVNIERGMPRVDTAIQRLRMEIATHKRLGTKSIKIIHGYGSSGPGGSIRQATQQYCRDQMRQGRIKGYCPGECFDSGSNQGRQLAALDPQLRKDADWGRQNDGVTVVVLK